MKIKERRKRLQNKGFTLIELIVTIAIISFGDIICANCEFVSILSNLGLISTTF